MGELIKLDGSSSALPQVQTYYAGKGTLMRVGLNVPEGKRRSA